MKIGIIGAGISGLYLAWKLSAQGHEVVVFERKGEIGNDVCSGLFSQRILDFIPQSQKLIENRISYTLLHFPKKTVRVDFSKEFLVMSHFELDKLVANLAQQSGAKLVLGYNVKKISNGFDPSPSIEGEGFDRIIGCDGVNSFVRKKLNLPKPNYRLGILGFTNSVKIGSRRIYVETWPCRNGFIWKIPRGDRIEYGIMASPNEANKIFDDFLKKNNISLEKKAKLIPQGLALPKSSLITLCGDAAGLTKSWSGGGVIWSLTASDILLKTFPDFNAYRKKTKRFFTLKIALSKIAVKFVYFAGFKTPWILPKKNKMESDFLF